MELLYNKNITIFGDSIAKGVFLNNLKIQKITPNAAEIVEDNFGVKITNNSMFGQTLKRIYEKGIIENYILNINPFQKNLAVIALGGNDSDYCWEEVEKLPNYSHSPKTMLFEYDQMLNDIIQKLKANNVQVVVCSLFPIDSNRYFNNVLAKKYDSQKIMEFFNGDITNIARHQEIFNIECMKIALKNGCEFLDYRSQLLNLRNFLDYLCDDGIHPNQMGQKFIAEYITQKICEKEKYHFCIPNLQLNHARKV